LALLALAVTAFAGSLLHAGGQLWQTGPEAGVARALVRELRLTDLCLFTEARYTRHPSQADLHTPFQDHPLALEHFPSGSLLGPPRHLTDHALARPTALSH
jgi:hypothetical protein